MRDPRTDEELALARSLQQEEPGATSAWARVTAGGEADRFIAAGHLAVLVDPGPAANPYRVGTLPRAGAAEAHRWTLEQLEAALADGSRPLLVPGHGAVGRADFQVEILPGGVYQILDASGEPLPHQGEAIAIDGAEAVVRLLDRLDQLAHFREVEDLSNPDPSSPLSGRLRDELFALQKKEDWRDAGAPASVGTAPVRSVAPGSFRTLETITPVSHEWVVETVEVRVVRSDQEAASRAFATGAFGLRE